MKDLIIGTTLKDGSSTQKKWLETQLAFIRETTDEFDHVCVINGEFDESFAKFENDTILLDPAIKNLGGSRAHQQSLTILRHFFESKKNEYRYFMFLDCDAFPIRKGWLKILIDKTKDKELAAIIRPENMELRLHASIMMVKPEALQHMSFMGTKVGHRMDGSIEKDINVPYYEENRGLTFGMVRSNKHNIHPVGCGIYFDLFYHHTNGGDCVHIDKSKFYWDHMIPPTQNLFQLRDELFANPTDFVKKLGWNPDTYAIIKSVCPDTACQS